MLFLWKNTQYGKIWLDGDEIKHQVAERLQDEDCFCHEVSFVADKSTLHLFINYPEGYDEGKRNAAAKKIMAIFKPSGLILQIHWSVRSKEQPVLTISNAWKHPLFWGGLGCLAVSVVHLGVKGILWAVLAGGLSYGISWLILTEDGKRISNSVVKEFKKSK